MNMSFTPDQIFSLSSGVIVTEIDGESVLLNSNSGQYFGLNNTGTKVLQLVENKQPYSSICEQLASTYPDNAQDVVSDISALLKDMMNQQLINSA